MFIELVDRLRCPRPHEDSWLVAAVTKMSGRDIVQGSLGCPVCHAEYAIADGVALFGVDPHRPPPVERNPYDESDADAAMRCAALLDLFDPGGLAVLGGRWGRSARGMLDIAQTALLLIEPPTGVDLGTGVSAARVSNALPLAAASTRGIALDETTGTPSLIASAARALVPGGRLVAPISATMPDGMRERARDDQHWVAEAAPASARVIPITPRRAR